MTEKHTRYSVVRNEVFDALRVGLAGLQLGKDFEEAFEKVFFSSMGRFVLVEKVPRSTNIWVPAELTIPVDGQNDIHAIHAFIMLEVLPSIVVEIRNDPEVSTGSGTVSGDLLRDVCKSVMWRHTTRKRCAIAIANTYRAIPGGREEKTAICDSGDPTPIILL